MTGALTLFSTLSDEALISRVEELARSERQATAQLVAALAELDRRKLYLPQGCSSLFTYCTQILHLSEHAAYNRIEAARAAARFPAVLDRLESGEVSLTAVRLLAPVMTPENHVRVLEAARHRPKRDVEVLVAGLRPEPDARTIVRKLASPTPPNPSVIPVTALAPPGETGTVRVGNRVEAPRSAANTAPLTAERYKIQFTASREFHDKLRRAQTLLRHAVRGGELEDILGRALDLLLDAVEKRRLGATDRPGRARPTAESSRHVPAAVKREVWRRDGGRCAFAGAAGRCTEEAFLEFHHVIPFAAGGAATTDNIQLRCRAHNAYEAGQFFGRLLDGEDDSDTRSGTSESAQEPSTFEAFEPEET